MVATELPKLHRRRLLPWLVGAALLGVIGLYVLSLSFMANERLAVAVAAADHDNPHWRLDDLLANREKVPDAENSAIVLQKLDDLLPKDWPSVGTGVPSAPATGKNTVEDAFLRLDDLSANVRPDASIANVLRAELKTYEQALAIARTVASFPKGRHEVVLGPTLIDTLLPETQAVRRVARLLKADAAIRAEDGDADGALESCRASIGAARSIGDEPMLISALVRIAIDANAMQSARRALGQGEPSEPALAKLQALILDEKSQPLLYTAMNGERAFLVELIARVETGKVPASKIVPGTGTGVRMLMTVAGGFGGQQALALEWMNDAIAISRRPTSEQLALWSAWDAKIGAFNGRVINRFTAALPSMLTPAASSSAHAYLRSQAELGSMAILIAAERQRQRSGKWPASIKEIDPGILKEAPLDPFNGQPFHFEHRDGQLFVYSVGRNGTDEHGKYDRKRSNSGGPDDAGASVECQPAPAAIHPAQIACRISERISLATLIKPRKPPPVEKTALPENSS